jgi:hypothetical protein
MSRRSHKKVAFDLFGLLCTKQPLFLLLLEVGLGHGIGSRSGGHLAFACQPAQIF